MFISRVGDELDRRDTENICSVRGVACMFPQLIAMTLQGSHVRMQRRIVGLLMVATCEITLGGIDGRDLRR